jgi:large subunit ribosomal protein L3
MSRTFAPDGRAIPVTLIEAGPCTVTFVDEARRRVQLGFGRARKLNKPLAGHLRHLPPHRHLREFVLSADEKLPRRGDKVTVKAFRVGDVVKVSGISRGRGFAGVVKRHGFSGGPASHGHRHVLRRAGSIGSQFPQRVIPGKKMAGHYGAERITVKGLAVVDVQVEKNLLAVSGAVPGAPGTLLVIAADTCAKPRGKLVPAVRKLAEEKTKTQKANATGKPAKKAAQKSSSRGKKK